MFLKLLPHLLLTAMPFFLAFLMFIMAVNGLKPAGRPFLRPQPQVAAVDPVEVIPHPNKELGSNNRKVKRWSGARGYPLIEKFKFSDLNHACKIQCIQCIQYVPFTCVRNLFIRAQPTRSAPTGVDGVRTSLGKAGAT